MAGCNDACTVELQYTVNNGGRPIEKNCSDGKVLCCQTVDGVVVSC